MTYPKRLIEVDLPIKRISAHARREKSIRHGHISTLHIWWARRPLAACRAVICASLWPDPEDLTAWLKAAEAERSVAPVSKRSKRVAPANSRCDLGPEIRAPRGCKPTEGVLIRPRRFLDEARKRMTNWAQRHMKKASAESMPRQVAIQKAPAVLNDPAELRRVLLDFIADFANWDNSTEPAFLETARALTQAAHEALGGEPGSRPLVVDPFAGGGSIPLEALRVGADAFASDLNPVAVLLNKVVLEYIPKYGQKLADEVRKWGQSVKEQAEKELAEFYPKDPDGATPIAYLWARTVLSEAPTEFDERGQLLPPVEVPLIRSLWLCKKKSRQRALRWARDARGRVKTKTTTVKTATGESRSVRRPLLETFTPETPREVENGTVQRGSATCPVTAHTMPVAAVRRQLRERFGGAADARLFCVVYVQDGAQGRQYRLPQKNDWDAAHAAAVALRHLEEAHRGAVSILPDEEFTGLEPRRIPVPQYGLRRFRDLFSPRQLLALATYARFVGEASEHISREHDAALAEAVNTCLALTLSRGTDLCNTLCVWKLDAECPVHLFGRQAIPMVWEFAEAVITAEASGSWSGMVSRTVSSLLSSLGPPRTGTVAMCSATAHPLPDDSAHAIVTDPPYYFSVPYADLSDFFYVWLRRLLCDVHSDLFASSLTPKDQECIQNLPHSAVAARQKDRAFYEESMTRALSEARRIAPPSGTGLVVFAHTDTAAWESLIKALIEAGWCITASWPIDTELAHRVISQRQSTLGSSVHLVCRPRENPDGSVREDDIGEWQDVLGELPRRIHEWMPRLAEEGVVGADAIFACLGPALEIFSQYSRVEKASGEVVTLGEYLEQVWAAVSKEALSMLFADADASGLEPDARLTAMWLWTLGAGNGDRGSGNGKGTKARRHEGTEGEEDDAESNGGKAKTSGYVLEYDAARKIAQGLGAHLDKLQSVVEVKGDKARLLSVAERTKYLFGKDAEAEQPRGRRRKKSPQLSLFAELEAAEQAAGGGWGGVSGPSLGATALDRVHQAMILFAAGRGEALKRFLVEDGAGTDARFWKLAQSLSALYPTGTDEKRWVDGLLGRKKGLGF